MAFTLFQSGTSLYGMDQRGSTTALTLPTGVTLDSTLAARFAVFGRYVVMVNSPSRPLTIDGNLNVRVLCPDPPAAAVTVASASGGTLSGTFKARQTYRVYEPNSGRLIAESDYGPDSASATIASAYLRVTNGNLSPDTVSASKYYRTTNGQAVYFPWLELEGNTQTDFRDDLSDAGLQTFSAPRRGTPPDLALVTEFKSRLYGVSKGAVDDIKYSEVGEAYAWPSDNTEPMPSAGADKRGIIGFARRRDELGAGRTNALYKLSRTGGTLSITNVTENAGFVSPDAVRIFRDVAYFPWLDGVYTWGAGGVKNISDGQIRRWFTTDDTFNLSRLPYAFALIDPLQRKYRLYLASAGSSVEDCWIEYDIETGKWWGPHSSHAMNPASAFLFSTDSGIFLPMVGGTDGFCRVERKRRVDDANEPIDMDVVVNETDYDTPRHEKHFGELTVFAISHDNGTPHKGKLDVQTTTGEADEPRTAVSFDPTAPVDQMDLGNTMETLGRVGDGKAMKIRFRNNEENVDVAIRGFEVDPAVITGRR